MWTIESARAERPYPGKGHDRVFADVERNIFGVFDGAGNPFASDLAIASLEGLVNSPRTFNVVTALRKIHADILNEFGGNYLTTGALVHLRSEKDLLTFNFAAAGDSPIYRYGHSDGAFQRETHDEGQRFEGYTDASNFLGSPDHKLNQAGIHNLSEDSSLVIVSDGITDETAEGHLTDEIIGKIMAANETAEETAQRIMTGAGEFDDASVVVVKAHQASIE